MKLKSGSGTEEVPVSRWIYLPLLSFLIPFANAKSSRSNLEVGYTIHEFNNNRKYKLDIYTYKYVYVIHV